VTLFKEMLPIEMDPFFQGMVRLLDASALELLLQNNATIEEL
jgi:hypothetical protein